MSKEPLGIRATERYAHLSCDPSITGLDEGERHWLTIHEESLRQHIEALNIKRSDGESLLEFGEFLRRPAHITQRLTWR